MNFQKFKTMCFLFTLFVFLKSHANTDVVLSSDYDTLQNAVDAAAGKVLFIDKIWDLDSTVLLNSSIIIRGRYTLGTNGANIKNTSNENYLFATNKAGIHVEFQNISLQAYNALDLRCHPDWSDADEARSTTGSVYMRGCLIIAYDTDTTDDIPAGIGLNIWHHQFSKIEYSKFTGFSCAVRACGAIAIPGTSSNHDATQIGIYDCVFTHNIIGISCEVIADTKINGNDFQNNEITVDIGGVKYGELSTSIDKYHRTADVSANVPTKRFSNINIFQNHFEGFNYAIWAKGIRTINHGLRVRDNSFNISTSNVIAAMRLDSINGLYTSGNEMKFDTNLTKIGIIFKGCANPVFLNDNFYGNGSNPYYANTNAFIDSGDNKKPYIDPINNGNDMYDPCPRATIGNNKSIKIPKATTQHWSPLNTDKRLNLGFAINSSKSNMDSIGDTLQLISNFNSFSTGIVVLHIWKDGVDEWSNTWAIGNASAVRVSGDDMGTYFNLKLLDNKLVLEQNFTAPNQVQVQGAFIGMGVN